MSNDYNFGRPRKYLDTEQKNFRLPKDLTTKLGTYENQTKVVSKALGKEWDTPGTELNKEKQITTT